MDSTFSVAALPLTPTEIDQYHAHWSDTLSTWLERTGSTEREAESVARRLGSPDQHICLLRLFTFIDSLRKTAIELQTLCEPLLSSYTLVFDQVAAHSLAVDDLPAADFPSLNAVLETLRAHSNAPWNASGFLGPIEQRPMAKVKSARKAQQQSAGPAETLPKAKKRQYNEDRPSEAPGPAQAQKRIKTAPAASVSRVSKDVHSSRPVRNSHVRNIDRPNDGIVSDGDINMEGDVQIERDGGLANESDGDIDMDSPSHVERDPKLPDASDEGDIDMDKDDRVERSDNDKMLVKDASTPEAPRADCTGNSSEEDGREMAVEPFLSQPSRSPVSMALEKRSNIVPRDSPEYMQLLGTIFARRSPDSIEGDNGSSMSWEMRTAWVSAIRARMDIPPPFLGPADSPMTCLSTMVSSICDTELIWSQHATLKNAVLTSKLLHAMYTKPELVTDDLKRLLLMKARGSLFLQALGLIEPMKPNRRPGRSAAAPKGPMLDLRVSLRALSCAWAIANKMGSLAIWLHPSINFLLATFGRRLKLSPRDVMNHVNQVKDGVDTDFVPPTGSPLETYGIDFFKTDAFQFFLKAPNLSQDRAVFALPSNFNAGALLS